jgi:hypothetical protein
MENAITMNYLEIEGLKILKPKHFQNALAQKTMDDCLNCFNTWQNNAYLSPEQLRKMENDMVFYVTVAVVSEAFSPFLKK